MAAPLADPAVLAAAKDACHIDIDRETGPEHYAVTDPHFTRFS